MFFFCIQIIIIYYFGNYVYNRFRIYQEDKNISEELSKKADITFVMNQLIEKADRNSIIDFNNIKEFDLGKNSSIINIGNNSHFRNQNINIGYLTINKNGILLDKIPIIKFNSNTMIYCSNNNIYIREGNITIKLSDLFYELSLNKDRIKKNEINLNDIKIMIENKYYDKTQIQNKYYNKYYIDQNYISKEESQNILVNNQGYTKNESNLIFMSRKDINDNFINKEYFENITNDKFNIPLSFNNNVISNYYLLCLNNNNTIGLCNQYKTKNFIGISYIINNEKKCIKPNFSYIWVSNYYGNISKGDLIVSYINGYGCKQDEDILKSCTIGKCVENVSWENDENEKKIYCLIY